MEEIINGGYCPITGWLVSNAGRQDYNWKYTVTCGKDYFNLLISNDCLNSQAVREQKHLVRWLIVTDRINTIKAQDLSSPSKFLLTEKIILDTITESFVPITPKEKSEQLLILLYRVFPTFKGDINRGIIYCLSFFHNIEEYRIYLNYLKESGYVSIIQKSSNVNQVPYNEQIIEPEINVEFKFQGIQLLASLEENGRNSKNCFIAMSFSEEPKIKAIKEAIIAALVETKYNAVIINDKHIESDRTINDAIIAEIKRAKFVIADFTEQKSGVYFEAGFALGIGIPVIYCCDKTNFKKSHFDINHYPHILYNSPEVLRKGLVDKIRAWID